MLNGKLIKISTFKIRYEHVSFILEKFLTKWIETKDNQGKKALTTFHIILQFCGRA